MSSLLGEDIGVYGGAFGVTGDLVHRFGEDRVRDTPISELGIAGAAVGAALTGMRRCSNSSSPTSPTLAMEQIVNQAAKIRYMFGGKAPCRWSSACRRFGHGRGGPAQPEPRGVVRARTGTQGRPAVDPVRREGPAARRHRRSEPVMIFEHKLLYKTKGPVPEEPYRVPIGKAEIRRQGRDVTIAATSMMVIRAVSAAEWLAAEGIEAEVIDLRTIRPMDTATLIQSVSKTGRLLSVYEGAKTLGIGAEVSAAIAESEAFDLLDAPIARLGAREVPLPYNPTLEKAAVPQEDDIVNAARRLVREEGLMAVELSCHASTWQWRRGPSRPGK